MSRAAGPASAEGAYSVPVSGPDTLSGADWRRIGVSVYLPTALSLTGISAATPLLALTAHELGASTPEAALIVSLLGIGSLLGALPAGVVAARFGEKRALIGSLLVDAACLLTAALATALWLLGVAVFVLGLSGAMLLIARQAFLTEFVPFRYRARALSTLGGVFRIGAFAGPVAGAAVVSVFDLRAAYLLGIGTSLAAAAASALLPDLAAGEEAAAPVRMGTVLRQHARTYATIGVGAAALMLVRASRDSLLPLWSAQIGLDAARTSLVFAVSSGVDLTLFYLGGSIMDRVGRRAVAAPAMLVMGTCFGLMPLATSLGGLTAVAASLGLGNGISSGVVMTLGSDASPAVGRHHFLAGWRLTTGIGQAVGPLAVAGMTTVAPLAWACVAVGVLGWLGAAWLWHWASPERLRSIADRVAPP